MITSGIAAEVPGPAHRIRSISVVGGFLDGAHFELADGLNCFIGARGAGKTTVLEFVRYALDLLPVGDQAHERRRIESLVEKNLAGGHVEVAIETKDGLAYIVSRSAGEDPMVLTPDRSPTDVTFKSGNVFRADIYSQNEIELIADRTTSQLVLLDNFEAEQIAELESQMAQVRAQLSANVNQITPMQSRITSLTEDVSTLAVVEDRLKKFAKDTGEDAATINLAHRLKALRDLERQHLERRVQDLNDIKRELAGSQSRLKINVIGPADQEITKGPNAACFQTIAQQIESAARNVDALLVQAAQCLNTTAVAITNEGGFLSARHKQQELEFRTLIEKHQSAQGQATERAQLERKRNELIAKRRERDQLTRDLQRLLEQRQSLLGQLNELRDSRFHVRTGVVARINADLQPAIRVELTQCGNPERYHALLEEGLKGTRLKHLVVAKKLAEAFWPHDMVDLVRRRDSSMLVERADLNPEQADKVLAALSNAPILYELESVDLLDLPRIQLKDGDSYKDSTELSTGQKCTTILPILLLDSDNPLMVDQPEDNLDNRFIFEAVVNSIRKVKNRRQMIFVTHNPNIPVLGDAECVFVLDSNGAKSHKSNEGTVDQCKADIVTLLEGGEDAFKARK